MGKRLEERELGILVCIAESDQLLAARRDVVGRLLRLPLSCPLYKVVALTEALGRAQDSHAEILADWYDLTTTAA